MSQAQAGWWSDVEHLREAAERRIAERERAQREGRDPLLTPLGVVEPAADPAPAPVRFRRASVATGTPAAVAARHRAAAATTGALAHDLAPVEETWGDLDRAAPAPTPERQPEPAADPPPQRADRRAELRRLAREQAEAAERPTRTTTRRTIEIRGQVRPPVLTAVPDLVDIPPASRRRPSRTPAERFAARPDRVAQWAFLLGLFLIVVALLSAH